MPNVDYIALTEYLTAKKTGHYTPAAIRAELYLKTLPAHYRNQLESIEL